MARSEPDGDTATVALRDATPDDAAAISGLLDELGHPTTRSDVEARLRGRAHVPGHRVIVAETGGVVVGMVETHAVPFVFHEGPEIRVTTLVVTAGARRKGVGRRLLAAVEEDARRIGAPVLSLTTASHRADAQAFYRSLGWYVPTAPRFLKELE